MPNEINKKPQLAPVEAEMPTQEFNAAGQLQEEVDEKPIRPQEAVIDMLATIYASVFIEMFAPNDPASDAKIMPFIDCHWDKRSDTYEINFWPYPEASCTAEDGDIDPDQYDDDLNRGLKALFTELYERAGKHLRVYAPPNANCEEGEFILRSSSPLAFLEPLKILFEEHEVITRDVPLDYMAAPDSCKPGSDQPAFADLDEYARYRVERASTLERGFDKMRGDLKNPASAERYMHFLPQRTYLSHGDAFMSSAKMEEAQAVPFSLVEIELLIREELGLPAPDQDEYRRFDIH